MRQRQLLLFVSLLFLQFAAITIHAQQVADTVYFDEAWSICERPVANYYRVCTLNKIEQIYYKGPATDYYIKGQIEMTGQYDSKGSKKGHFIFYSANGNKVREGNYDGDKMTGLWSFYDKNGKLNAQFNCVSSTDFTPLLIINTKGDTLLKDGNGKFSFHSSTDLPNIFPLNKSYYVSGEIKYGKKEGRMLYSINPANEGSNFQEYYENGKFINAIDFNSAFKQNDERNTPYNFLDLQSEKLLKVDRFYTDDLAFSIGKNKEQKLIKFLLLKVVPDMVSEATSFEENTIDLFNIIGTVIRKMTVKEYMQKVSFSNPPTAKKSRLLSFAISADSTAPVAIKDTAEIDIDTSGYVSATAFKGNLSVKSINTINFYLEHLSNLTPFSAGGVKKPSKVIIDIYTVVEAYEDEGKKQLMSYSYFGSCSSVDSASAGNAINSQ